MGAELRAGDLVCIFATSKDDVFALAAASPFPSGAGEQMQLPIWVLETEVAYIVNQPLVLLSS